MEKRFFLCFFGTVFAIAFFMPNFFGTIFAHSNLNVWTRHTSVGGYTFVHLFFCTLVSVCILYSCSLVYICTLAVHMFSKPPCWAVTPLRWVVYACILYSCSPLYVCTLAVHMFSEPPCWAVTPSRWVVYVCTVGPNRAVRPGHKKSPLSGAWVILRRRRMPRRLRLEAFYFPGGGLVAGE